MRVSAWVGADAVNAVGDTCEKTCVLSHVKKLSLILTVESPNKEAASPFPFLQMKVPSKDGLHIIAELQIEVTGQ